MMHAIQRQSAPTTEVEDLQETILTIDCLAQGGFSEIASIARLALSRLETQDGYRHLDDIANALSAIWGRADDTKNCINSEAGEVGCAFVDEARSRRMAAQMGGI